MAPRDLIRPAVAGRRPIQNVAPLRLRLPGRLRPRRLFFNSLLLRALVMSIAVVIGAAGGLQAAVAVIPVDHLDGPQVLPVARSLLSPEGRISFDPRTSALVVVDTPDAVARIRDMLSRLDLPSPQLVVRTRRHRPESRQHTEAGVSGRVTVPGGSVSVGKDPPENGIQTHLAQRRRTGSAGGEQLVRVASGSAAIITLGTEMPVREDLPADGYRRMDTGLSVIPVLQGDQVLLRVSTVATDAVSVPRGGYRSAAAHTEIRIPLGRWVALGGVLAETDSRLAAILQRESTDEDAADGFWIRVDRVTGNTGD